MHLGDAVFRCVLYPRGFDHEVLAEEQLVKLNKLSDGSEEYAISVAPRDRFGDEDARHEYGCRSANEANAGIAERKGSPLEPDEAVKYVGHYFISKEALGRLSFGYHFVNLIWRPENSLIEHCEISVSRNGYNATRKARRDERLELQVELAKLLFGPVRGTDPTDPDREELMKIELPDLPRTAA